MGDVGFITFIGKANEPLFFQVYGEGEELEMQLAAYAALDLIEDKLNAQMQSGGGSCTADPYLGSMGPALCFSSEYKLYAYVLTTGIKFLIALKDRTKYADSVIRKCFVDLHRIFADALCNPFLAYSFNTPSFQKKLNTLVTEWSLS